MKKNTIFIVLYCAYLLFLDGLLFKTFGGEVVLAAIVLSIFFTCLLLSLLYTSVQGSRFSLTLFSITQLLVAAIFSLFVFMATKSGYVQQGVYVQKASLLMGVGTIALVIILALFFTIYFNRAYAKPYAPTGSISKKKPAKYLASIHVFSLLMFLSFVSPIFYFALGGLLLALGVIHPGSTVDFFTNGIQIENKILQIAFVLITHSLLMWLGIWTSAHFFVNQHFTTQNNQEVVKLSTKYYSMLILASILLAIVGMINPSKPGAAPKTIDLISFVIQDIVAIYLFYFFSKICLKKSTPQIQAADSNTVA